MLQHSLGNYEAWSVKRCHYSCLLSRVLCTCSTKLCVYVIYSVLSVDDTHWKTAADSSECAINFLAGVVARHCYHQKATPLFTTSQLPVDLPGVTDPDIKEHFAKVFKGVKALIEKESKQNNLVELALSSPTFINLWDVGVNRALYQLLPGVASRCKRLVVVDVIDLERDVPNLHKPPEAFPDEAVKRGDSEIVMKLHSRLTYFLMFAGLKRWFNPDPSTSLSPEVTIIGTHTQSFASRDDGKHLDKAKQTLHHAIMHAATKMGIMYVIDPHIITYCTNKRDNTDDLNKVKDTIEQLIQSQADFQTDVSAKYIFLRSLFYDSSQLVTHREEVARKAYQCNLLDDKEIEKCLIEFRNAGSILYYPNLLPPPVRDQIIFNVVNIVQVLDKLFYLEYYNNEGTLSLAGQSPRDMELYKYGLLTESLAERIVGKRYCHMFLDYMISCEVCTVVEVSSQKLFFVPTVRNDFDASCPQKPSMYITYNIAFLQYDSLSLFPKFLHTVFETSEAQLVKTTQSNMFSFNYYPSLSSPPSQVRIIYHKDVVEVCVPSLQTTFNSYLSSGIIALCTKVFDHLSTYQQSLRYKLCIMCPNTYESVKHHYVPFYVGYRPNHKELYCNDCKGNIGTTDKDISAAACWLY